jgi:hypothetical protein
MSVDFSIRSVGASVIVPATVPQTSDATKNAVPTLLPSDKAATAASRVASQNQAQQDQEQTQTPAGTPALDYQHQVVLDANANSLVYQVVSNRTSSVVSQYPDDAQLKMRAYYKSQNDERETEQLEHTDRVA